PAQAGPWVPAFAGMTALCCSCAASFDSELSGQAIERCERFGLVPELLPGRCKRNFCLVALVQNATRPDQAQPALEIAAVGLEVGFAAIDHGSDHCLLVAGRHIADG